MRLPLPRNKLVALSIVGSLLAVGGAVALAAPGILVDHAPAAATPASASSTAAPAAHAEHEDEPWEHGDDDG